MNADSLNLPIGLQLYTVDAEMNRDPFGTLKRVAAIGYKQVELSPLSKTSSKDLKKGLDENGLKSISGHCLLQDLLADLPKKIDSAKQFGQEYIVVTVPGVADLSRLASRPGEDEAAGFLRALNSLTLDDWKWNAEQFNKLGEEIRKAGLQLGYHNHNFDFKPYGDVTGYDEFLRLTDPSLVKLELDCGWMTVAGKDPVTYLTKYPDRYRLLHVKDFRKGFTPHTGLMDNSPGAPIPTELGRGAIDYRRIFPAAKTAEIKAIFVEQEPPFKDMPALDSIKIDYEYVNRLHA